MAVLKIMAVDKYSYVHGTESFLRS